MIYEIRPYDIKPGSTQPKWKNALAKPMRTDKKTFAARRVLAFTEIGL